MKIYCNGSNSYVSQAQRIQEGFERLGHTISSVEDADIIYSNDPSGYSEDHRLINKKAKIIYNVLDLPPHCIDPNKFDISRYTFVKSTWKRDFDPMHLKNKLKNADIITCICDEVQWQLKNWCQLDSKVIHNPIKDVSFLNLSKEQKIKNKQGKTYKYLYVGRANDPNKRFYLIYEMMRKLNESPDSLAVLGSENPGWGDYYGVVEDKVLNLFYNSVDYFLFPSAFKSIGLPALESVVTKTIPIVTNDDPVTKEFWAEIGVDHDKIAETILNEDWNIKAKNFVEKNSNLFKSTFDKQTIANNILNLI